MKTKTEVNHAKEQAKAQLASIREMVIDLISEDDEKRMKAQETIEEDPLSVETRSGWHTVGTQESQSDAEFNILLCTGGPACRIVGTLSEHAEPESARIEYQDWGTPWTEYRLTAEEEEDVLKYARCFYFGE